MTIEISHYGQLLVQLAVLHYAAGVISSAALIAFSHKPPRRIKQLASYCLGAGSILLFSAGLIIHYELTDVQVDITITTREVSTQ